MLKVYGEATSPFGFGVSDEDARELDKFLDESEVEVVYFRKEMPGYEYCIEKEKSDVSVITDNTVDLEKEVVDLASVNWNFLRKVPHVAYRHNYDLPPVGRAKWIKPFATCVKAKTTYDKRPESLSKDEVWFPDVIYDLVMKGFLPGKSVGGVAQKFAITDEYLTKHPNAAGADIVRMNARVYEYSVCPVACNKNAVVETLAKGLANVKDDILLSVFPEIADAVIDVRKSFEVPVVKDYLSVTQYSEDMHARLEIELESVMERVPEMIDKVLKRMLGQVS